MGSDWKAMKSASIFMLHESVGNALISRCVDLRRPHNSELSDVDKRRRGLFPRVLTPSVGHLDREQSFLLQSVILVELCLSDTQHPP